MLAWVPIVVVALGCRTDGLTGPEPRDSRTINAALIEAASRGMSICIAGERVDPRELESISVSRVESVAIVKAQDHVRFEAVRCWINLELTARKPEVAP